MVKVSHVTVGLGHALPARIDKVVKYAQWLQDHPGEDLPPIEVAWTNYYGWRVWDGRHRFLAYVLAEREFIPAVAGGPEGWQGEAWSP